MYLGKGGPKACWGSWICKTRGIRLKVLTKIVDLSVFSFFLSHFLLYIWRLCYYAHTGLFYLPSRLTLFIKCPLSLIMLLTLKSTRSAIMVATPAFFWLMVARYTFPIFLLSPLLYLYTERKGIVSDASKSVRLTSICFPSL